MNKQIEVLSPHLDSKMHSETDNLIFDSDKKYSMETLDTQNSQGKLLDSPKIRGLKNLHELQTPTPPSDAILLNNSKNSKKLVKQTSLSEGKSFSLSSQNDKFEEQAFSLNDLKDQVNKESVYQLSNPLINRNVILPNFSSLRIKKEVSQQKQESTENQIMHGTNDESLMQNNQSLIKGNPLFPPRQKGTMSKLQMFREKLMQSSDHLQINNIEQKTSQFENKFAFSSANISIRSIGSKSGMSSALFKNNTQGSSSKSPISPNKGIQALSNQIRKNAALSYPISHIITPQPCGICASPLKQHRRGLTAKLALIQSVNKLKKLNQSPLTNLKELDNLSPSPTVSPTINEELDEDTRTFEEKYYVIESLILGEGCASIVKECLLRSTPTDSTATQKFQRLVNRKMSSPVILLQPHDKTQDNSSLSLGVYKIDLNKEKIEEEADAESSAGLTSENMSEQISSKSVNIGHSSREKTKVQKSQFQNDIKLSDTEDKSDDCKSNNSISDESSEFYDQNEALKSQKLNDLSSPHESKKSDQYQQQASNDSYKDMTTVKFESGNFLKDQDSKKKFAVKIIRANDEELMEVAYEEYKLLMTLDHPNIVKMHDAFFNQMKETMYLVMDLVQGCSLKTLLDDQQVKLTQKEVKYIFSQLLQVIGYLQDSDVAVCHRDINPNNIMINYDPDSQDHLKLTLIDFNVSKRFKQQSTGSPLLMMTNTGTAKYQAPEMLQGWMSYYDEKIDLWSAGAVLYYLLTSFHAFNFDSQKDIENAINLGEYDIEIEEYTKIEQEAKDLILGLMTVDTYKRFTIEQAQTAKWLQNQ